MKNPGTAIRSPEINYHEKCYSTYLDVEISGVHTGTSPQEVAGTQALARRYIDGNFGSWVRGEQTVRSDLDILIEFDQEWKISLYDLVSLELELSDYLGVPVDLVEKNTVKPALRHRILNEAIPL